MVSEMRKGKFNRVERAERVEKGLGVSSQELVPGEVIAHAKSAKFAKSDVESQKSGTDFFNAEKQSSREAEKRLALAAKNAESAKVWPMVRLGDVCEINYGTRVRKRDSKGDAYPVYGGGGETFRWDSYNRIDKCVVSRFAMSAECVRFVNGPFFLNDSGLTVESKLNQLTQVYLDWFLFGNQDLIYSIGKGSAQKNLDMKEFADIQIPLPPINVQKEIVVKLDAAKERCEKLKAAAERGLRAAENLRKAILSEAF